VVSHEVVVGVALGGRDVVKAGTAVGVASRHPNQPGVSQVVVDVAGSVVVVGSLQPNQPGVLQLVVVVVVDVVVAVSVVLSSRQPHQPGVLQVDVLVALVELVEVAVEVVVISEPLLRKNFHSSQS